MGGFRLFNAFAHFVEVAGETNKFVVKLSAEAGDFQRVSILFFLPPDGSDRFQGCEESGGGNEDHFFPEGVVKESGVLAEGFDEGGLDRHEEKDNLRGAEVLDGVVSFAGKVVDVGAE